MSALLDTEQIILETSMAPEIKPITVEHFKAYEIELVGDTSGMHVRLAALLGTSEVGIKRYATGARPIPGYIAQSIRAMVLLKRKKILADLGEMP